MDDFESMKKSAGFIREKITAQPEIAVILGSGLGSFANAMENAASISYSGIPGFKKTTAIGHEGSLVIGEIGGKIVAALKGRHHYYEGYEFSDVVYPIRVLSLLGVKTCIITNAAGGINESFSPGDLMFVCDHIKFFEMSPLRGANIDALGPRFPDMTECYDKALINSAKMAAKTEKIPIKEGVYAYMPGPQYETPAEIRALRILGADAVGMSSVAEAIACAHMGIKVLGISAITNLAAGMSGAGLSGGEVIEKANEMADNFKRLLKSVIEKI